MRGLISCSLRYTIKGKVTVYSHHSVLFDCSRPAYLAVLMVGERWGSGTKGELKRTVKSRLWVCFRGSGCSFARWPNETTIYTQAMIIQ